MTCGPRFPGVLLVALFVPAPVHAQAPPKTLPTAPVPGKSLPAGPASSRVTRSFPAGGVDAVILRAEAAERAEVVTTPGGRVVTVSGVPAGSVVGYHPSDPNWRETPASRWGLDFQAKAFGRTLVVSSSAEIRYIHHYYHLDDVRVAVPPGVKVVKENRTLAGDGAPDLAAPAAW